MPAMAQTVVDGIQAQDKKDYKKALEIFEKLARAGNVEAMFNLAKMVQAGYGIENQILWPLWLGTNLPPTPILYTAIPPFTPPFF